MNIKRRVQKLEDEAPDSGSGAQIRHVTHYEGREPDTIDSSYAMLIWPSHDALTIYSLDGENTDDFLARVDTISKLTVDKARELIELEVQT